MEKRNFLIMAASMGAVGILIGSITIWNAITEIISK